jgi:penicillin-binding protein 1A
MANNTDSSRKSKHTKKSSSGSLKKWLIISTTVFAVMVLGLALGFLTATLNTKPSLVKDIRPSASSQIYDINGNLITNIHSVENRVPVKFSQLPKDLINAFIAVEDARFYQHSGVDPRGIMRAVWSNITQHSVSEGGSTITQQLAKNAYLSQEQTLRRKIQEAFLALQLERQYSKNEILELYLNQIYFGQGAYGVQAAAQLYFGKNVEDLSLSECAMLAGIPKSPNYYSPLNNFKAANERKSTVLDQMEKYNYIDSSTNRKAKSEEIKLAKHTDDSNNASASYFVEYVTQKLIDKYGADAVYKEGLQIYTTLDMNMQKAAENSMTNLPTYRTDDNGIAQPQGALVAIDPHTGYIKAMVGGRGNDKFNRATMAERQPGSAFKPFVFLAALESDFTPSTIIDDSPITISGWSPQNYDGGFSGKVTLRQTAENSLNVPTVKIAKLIGIDKPLYYAQQLGISTLVLEGSSNDRNLSSSLGGLTRGVTPLELASAYSAFANNGNRAEPTAIVKIVDRNGKVLEQHTVSAKNVISEQTAYVLTDMLKGVVERGTGTRANIGRPAAGKTGTTSDYKDAWFVGYTPDLVAVVWMGNDSDGTLRGITGGNTPAVIWKDFMTAALSGTPVHDFTRPDGVVINDTPKLLDTSDDKDKKNSDKTTTGTKDTDKSADTTKQDEKSNTKQDTATSAKEEPAIPAAPTPIQSAAPPAPEKTNKQ